MRGRLSGAGAGLLLALAAADAGAQATAFVGATVFDATGAPPLRDAVVLIEDGRVAAVGPRSQAAIPEGARRVDLAGRWIVPGLVDAHAHFFQSGGLYTRPDVIDLRAVRPYEAEIAAAKASVSATFVRYLASGVTAVLDIGGPMWTFEVRARASAARLAPRVAVAGPLLATWVPDALGAVADPPMVLIRTPAEARAQVQRLLARRPDLVKLWFIRTGSDVSGQIAWVRAAIDEAHRGGARVAVHATERSLAEAVVQAGADVLAHSVEDQRLDASLLGLMRSRGVVYVTTLVVHEGYRRVLGRRLDLSDIERRLGDPQAIASFADLARLPARLLPDWIGRLPPPALDPVMAENLRRVRAAGITVAAGSDAGNIGTLPGPGLHRELERMVEAGLSPAEAVIAASRGGAAAMGRERDLGTLEPGKLADFLVLAADPLADIRNLRRIEAVVKGGEAIPLAELLSALSR